MKRLVKKSEKSGNNWFVYHSTSIDNIESIEKNGLQPNGGYISLGGTFNGAEEWGYLKGDEGFVVIKFSLIDSDIENIKKVTSEWKDFYEDYFINDIAKQEGYEVIDVVEGRDTFEEFIQSVKNYEGEEYYKTLEERALEVFFNEYELNMNTSLPPSQIVEISEPINS